MPNAPTLSDEQLYAGLRRGEAAALNALFRRHYAPLCRTADRFVRDHAAAEDIVQDLFTHLWTNRRKLPEENSSVAGYLKRAARNRSLNYLRDKNRLPLHDGEMPDPPAPAAPPNGPDDRTARITAAVDRLPDRCRLVFVMCKLEGMSQAEVARDLDISVKTVENQMTRAYKHLREWLS